VFRKFVINSNQYTSDNEIRAFSSGIRSFRGGFNDSAAPVGDLTRVIFTSGDVDKVMAWRLLLFVCTVYSILN